MKALSRKKAHRKSTLRNLVTSLILYERIETSSAKVKEVRPIVEHLINLAKKNNLEAKRSLLGYIFDKNAVKKVFEVYVPRYKTKKSGFIKIYKKGPRLGDASQVSILEFEKIKESEIKEEENASKKSQQKKESESKGKSRKPKSKAEKRSKEK